MTPQELKAIRLVLENKTRIVYQNQDVLSGRVQGDHGTYLVWIDPDGPHCDCPYGREHGGRHSHTIALQLAAAYEQEEVVAC